MVYRINRFEAFACLFFGEQRKYFIVSIDNFCFIFLFKKRRVKGAYLKQQLSNCNLWTAASNIKTNQSRSVHKNIFLVHANNYNNEEA